MQLAPAPTGVSLRKLLAPELIEPAAPGTPDVRAVSCTGDCRQVRRGDVFVALADDDSDGHDRAVQAARRGAVAIVCERHLPVFNVPQFVVGDSRAAYGRICQALVGDPSRELKVIGITGTSGKSTVARLLTAIFRHAGAHAGILDSFGYWDGWDDGPAAEAALTAPLLARRLAEMNAAGVTHAVVELSSRELSRSILSGVTLDAACITHVGRDHLDWHNSLENYRQAKRRILDHLDPDGVAIFNADDAVSVRMLADVNHPALTFGLRQPAEITAEIVEQHINEQTFILSAGDEAVGVRTEMIGDHQVVNCLAAAAVCLAYGVELTTIARGLESVDKLPGRMERVMCGQDFSVFVDAANSPDTLRACLRASRAVTTGRLICVFGADGEREPTERPAMGRVVGAMADRAIVTSNRPGGENAHEIAWQVRRGFADQRKTQLIVDRTEAIAAALEEARAGDTVVIAGLGDRNHEQFDCDQSPLDDCEVVRRLLRGGLIPAAGFRAAA